MNADALAAALARVDALGVHGWHRYALAAAARRNCGDDRGADLALGVLCRMVADDLGDTPETHAAVRAAITPGL